MDKDIIQVNKREQSSCFFERFLLIFLWLQSPVFFHQYTIYHNRDKCHHFLQQVEIRYVTAYFNHQFWTWAQGYNSIGNNPFHNLVIFFWHIIYYFSFFPPFRYLLSSLWVLLRLFYSSKAFRKLKPPASNV